MLKGLKICGISDPKTLDYILHHPNPPGFIGFITNYRKSKRFVGYEKLKELINVDKKDIKFPSVLVDPNDEILEKIKNLNFDYYQLYDVGPERTKQIKIKYGIKIITALTVSEKDDQKRGLTPYEAYKNGADWLVIGRDITKGNIKNNIQKLINHLDK